MATKNKVRLKFNAISDNPLIWKGIHAEHKFKNGFGVSVVRHGGSYGGSKDLFQLAVIGPDNSLHYANDVARGDVVGWLTLKQATALARQVKSFKKLSRDFR